MVDSVIVSKNKNIETEVEIDLELVNQFEGGLEDIKAQRYERIR